MRHCSHKHGCQLRRLRRHIALQLGAALMQELVERTSAYTGGFVLRGVQLDLVSTSLSEPPV